MPVHDWTRVAAAVFHDFHHGWIADVRRALNRGRLPRNVYSLLTNCSEGVGPSVADLTRPGGGLQFDSGLETGAKIVDESEWYARKAKSVTVRLAGTHQVLAALQIVSPGAKYSQSGFHAFVAKAQELLTAGVHLTIIDLFPPGPHDPSGIHPAVWGDDPDDEFRFDPAKPLTCVTYCGGRLAEPIAQAFGIGDALPNAALHLTADDFVWIPLEETYCTAFDAVPDVWREALDSTPVR